MYTKHITLTSYTALAHEIYFSLFYAYHIPLFTISTIYFADTEHRRHSFTSPLFHLLFSSQYHFTRHATCSPSCHHANNILTAPSSHIQHTHHPTITHSSYHNLAATEPYIAPLDSPSDHVAFPPTSITASLCLKP